MKTHIMFFSLLIFFSCFSSRNFKKCPVIVKALKETFKDDFFNQYRDEKGKLNIITEFKDVYNEISQCNSKGLSFTLLDSVNNDQSKYLSINDYSQVKIVRLQIGCYNNASEPYYVQYSTSFNKAEKGNLKLISSVSPFIDTVKVEK